MAIAVLVRANVRRNIVEVWPRAAWHTHHTGIRRTDGSEGHHGRTKATSAGALAGHRASDSGRCRRAGVNKIKNAYLSISKRRPTPAGGKTSGGCAAARTDMAQYRSIKPYLQKENATRKNIGEKRKIEKRQHG